MQLDADRLYEALRSRDRRFDGRFFTGVRTTGVYCRPVCPAPTPKRVNCRFYALAAAAEEAGFRPCRRCNPHAAPGTPAWVGAPAVVDRALRLIEGGVLDDRRSVDALAASLGIGGRQLRRLFSEHLGVSPASVARARRVHFARALLDETDLPASQVAFAAGFGSIRQFNDAIRGTYGRSPSELRRSRARHPEALVIRLPYRPPLAWDALLDFIGPRCADGVESVSGSRYRRTIEIEGAVGWMEVRPAVAGDALELALQLPAPARLLTLVRRVRRMFDLDADPMWIDEHLARDERLAPLVAARPGLRVPGCWDPFEMAVRAILGQQISVARATTLAGRLVDAFGKPVEGLDGLTHLFPAAATLAEADLRGIGITRAQDDAIRLLARAVASRSVSFEPARGLERFVGEFSRHRGVGPWTAHYVAMRAGSEPDAFPASDLGVLRGLGARTEREALAAAEAWRPWRAYATMHLWVGAEDGR